MEVASTREHCFVLAADVPFREYRAKVTSLVVDSAHRRKGIATLLLAACAKQSRLWSDHSELFLEVRNDNEGARQFYDKMGFRECFGWLIISCHLPYDCRIFWWNFSRFLTKSFFPISFQVRKVWWTRPTRTSRSTSWRIFPMTELLRHCKETIKVAHISWLNCASSCSVWSPNAWKS